MMHLVKVNSLNLANNLPLTLIAGPCVLESQAHAFEMAHALVELTQKLGIQLIYKTSFDKANRMSIKGVRGMGMNEALPIFADIREKWGCPVVTDVHDVSQCAPIAEVVDMLQIPALLCRQTDLLLAAGHTGKAINIKKGQFLAPWDMMNAIKKVESTGNKNITVCERGVCFGYNTLVSDMRAIPTLVKMGYPVVFDATHSVQQPGGLGDSTGGQREFVPFLARAAVSLGIAAVFMETHQDPDNAPSDGPNMVKFKDMPALLADLMAFDTLAKQRPIVLD